MAEKRHYGQFCALAAALEIIGERWTLLILRELLIGPARFGELEANLPGIGPNLLSARLRELTDKGVLERRRLADDARGVEYALTPLGEELRGPILDLARWGLGFLDERSRREGESRAAWGFLAVQAMVHRGEAPNGDESYEFHVDDDIFRIDVRAGQASAHHGPAAEAAIVAHTDAQTFIRIGAGMSSPFESVATGALRIEGTPAAIQRCIRLLGLETIASPPQAARR